MDSDYPFGIFKPFFNYAIKEFINFDVKNNFKKKWYSLKLCTMSVYKGKKKHVYIQKYHISKEDHQ